MAQATGALNGNKDGCPKKAVEKSKHQKREDSQLDSSPSPSPSPKSSKEHHKFKCPQKDLAETALTKKATHDSTLDCSYSKSDCKYNKVRWDSEQTVRSADLRCVENRGPC